MENIVKCPLCGREEEYGNMYEYRGAISCGDCFDKLQSKRDAERAEIIAEERHKTERFKGLDLSDSSIGKANRQILKADIEVAKKEGKRIVGYENGNKAFHKAHVSGQLPPHICKYCGVETTQPDEECYKAPN